jgi:hypothetical protein
MRKRVIIYSVLCNHDSNLILYVILAFIIMRFRLSVSKSTSQRLVEEVAGTTKSNSFPILRKSLQSYLSQTLGSVSSQDNSPIRG